ncbi:GntR family transcriptional regulator [Cohaesibacter gelatinilyticus]|uniref:Transcriptional regulator, GntR family n=1 Tax=Cohaesibacter gelatinilyticus TaxID=372072 RepID=A0A285PCZ5_9HYPH|nr:GntR family transcriptional regulator [Cohaesibacter gelatinilyticus]SNZ19318.1 transcriptional regulator, GntR family [Cohaesibacter gelatinilyticus]
MNSTLKAIRPVRRETLQSAVYEQLCELILEGNLAPGESITVASIAKAFNVSPMPVREAISRLMAAGALTVVSGRSIGVPRLDKSVFTDLRNVRLEVEATALRWAIANPSTTFHKLLEDKLDEMIETEQNKEAKGFLRANYEFHFTIYRQANSPILLETISNIWLRINPYFHLLQQSGHYKISNDQHRSMIEAIKKNDEVQAVEALKDDINSAHSTMVAQLKDLV